MKKLEIYLKTNNHEKEIYRISFSIDLDISYKRNTGELVSRLKRSSFLVLGASCHSVEEAKEAEALGCSYIIVGHIFETDCKKGLPGRGLEFLQNVISSVNIPVYAIGGINETNISQVLNVGADGACLMSSLMNNDNISQLMKK